MKKFYFLGLALFLHSCANIDYNLDLVKPNEIGLSENLYGKIFSIECGGNDYTNRKGVDKKCRYYMSETAYNNGYSYFTVLNSGRDTITSTENYTTTTPVKTYYRNSNGNLITSTSYVPYNTTYNTTKNYSYYMFLLIKEDEIGKWKNYYKVADYYDNTQKTREKRKNYRFK